MTEHVFSPGDMLRLINQEQIHHLLHLEVQQMEQEGFNVDPFRGIDASASRTHLIRQYEDLLNAPVQPQYPFDEPDTLPAIRAVRPPGPRKIRLNINEETLYTRIYGGWLGRVVGCVLGKPVEPWGLKDTITRYLRLADSYPLSSYVPRLVPFPDGFFQNPHADGTFLGEINGAPPDDDTDYTLLALHILETYGTGFTTSDVATEWLNHLAYSRTFTAERATYRNLIAGLSPERAAHLLNPEREYIGARIRADLYGFVAPGMPELAADLAYRDARLSHTKNGIYSAMFLAAMLAWSFVTDDIESIIRVGLSEIPANCRLQAAVQDVLACWEETTEWESAFDCLASTYQSYHPVHAINNTAVMVLALLYGQGGLETTICTAVMCGLDTDCNAANAGAVIGVMAGASSLPGKWTAPIHDTLYSSLVQHHVNRIPELAHRTASIAQNNLSKSKGVSNGISEVLSS